MAGIVEMQNSPWVGRIPVAVMQACPAIWINPAVADSARIWRWAEPTSTVRWHAGSASHRC